MKEKFVFPSREPQSIYDAEHPGMTIEEHYRGVFTAAFIQGLMKRPLNSYIQLIKEAVQLGKMAAAEMTKEDGGSHE